MEKIKWLFLMILFLKAPVAYSNWNDFLPQPLEKSDLLLMKIYAREKMKDVPIGTEMAWKNDETGINGITKITKVFTIKEFKCHEVLHRLTFKSGEEVQYLGTGCVNDAGRWEILPFTFPLR